MAQATVQGTFDFGSLPVVDVSAIGTSRLFFGCAGPQHRVVSARRLALGGTDEGIQHAALAQALIKLHGRLELPQLVRPADRLVNEDSRAQATTWRRCCDTCGQLMGHASSFAAPAASRTNPAASAPQVTFSCGNSSSHPGALQSSENCTVG
jgi:hypothetical protein